MKPQQQNFNVKAYMNSEAYIELREEIQSEINEGVIKVNPERYKKTPEEKDILKTTKIKYKQQNQKQK